MHWDWKDRSLTMSVGELSRFSLLAATDEGAGRWRMELGTHWHEVLQSRAAKSDPSWLREVNVEGHLVQNGWTFDLRGRIDLYKPGPDPVLKEIKTTSKNLPMEEDALRESYPQYFHQAMLYAFLMGKEGSFPRVELVFLEIQTGISQTVLLGDADFSALHSHLDSVIYTLEERQSHFQKLRHYKVPEPFSEWRPGQLEARSALRLQFEQHRYALFEAPTGFGKTGIAIELALAKLAAGEIDRIILLTGKNTGHAALIEQLEIFRERGHEVAIQAVRSRKDLASDEQIEQSINAREIAENWVASGLSAAKLLEDGIVDLEYTKILGERHGIPPWAISRILLPYADVWIADYNYLFDPGVSRIFHNIPTFDPSRTLLIIDEAHNLPERVRACHSHILDAVEIDQVLSEIRFSLHSDKLARQLDQLLSMIKKQLPAESIDPPLEADLLDLVGSIQSAIRESALGIEDMSLECMEWLWNISSIIEDWNHPYLPMAIDSPARGSIRISCLDAASVTIPVLDQFHQVLAMSATLKPWDMFLESIGIRDGSITAREGFPHTEAARIEGNAPWLEGCFEVLVDARVNTRYRMRERHFNLTAETIALSAEKNKGCTVAFFPSYAYAGKILERIEFSYPALRAALQPRDLPLEEQQDFLETALLYYDILLLVLGSRFSEGIDSLGGKVNQAIVVSPALPEVNSLQKERQKAFGGSNSDSFRKVYLIPGIRKVSQALGRLVRAPHHSARILLHGQRFLEPEYQDLLPYYLQPVDQIITNEEFDKKWLKSR